MHTFFFDGSRNPACCDSGTKADGRIRHTSIPPTLLEERLSMGGDVDNSCNVLILASRICVKERRVLVCEDDVVVGDAPDSMASMRLTNMSEDCELMVDSVFVAGAVVEVVKEVENLIFNVSICEENQASLTMF